MTTFISDRHDTRRGPGSPILGDLHIDGALLTGILAILIVGLAALYSAVGQNGNLLIGQIVRIGAALAAMLIMAQVEPVFLRRASPFIYVLGLSLLALVLLTGDVGKGAQRWLDLGVRFQPSEIMKLGLPLMLARLLHDRPLPPSFGMIVISLIVILAPVGMIAIQPDLGTAILLITHDRTLAKRCDRIVSLEDGRVVGTGAKRRVSAS